jgi:hypothetical protein
MTDTLQEFAKRTVEQPVHPAITAMAEKIALQHQPVSAVLAYGSALRDSNPENTLIDFYVLTQDASGISHNPLSRFLCSVVPPNVYYAEHIIDGKSYRAKYAVLPMEQLASKLKGDTANPYFWVRFAHATVVDEGYRSTATGISASRPRHEHGPSQCRTAFNQCAMANIVREYLSHRAAP